MQAGRQQEQGLCWAQAGLGHLVRSVSARHVLLQVQLGLWEHWQGQQEQEGQVWGQGQGQLVWTAWQGAQGPGWQQGQELQSASVQQQLAQQLARRPWGLQLGVLLLQQGGRPQCQLMWREQQKQQPGLQTAGPQALLLPPCWQQP